MITNTNTHFTSKEHYLAFRAAWANSVNNGKTPQAQAHVLYNILRNRAYDKGFTPITNTAKLQNGFRINHGLYLAVVDLKRLHDYAKEMVKDNCNKYRVERVTSLLSLFEGTVSIEMLAELNTPECKSMDPDYGKYKKVAEAICRSKAKPITYDDIQDLYEITSTEAA